LRTETKTEPRGIVSGQRTFNKEVIDRVRKDREKYGVQSE